MKAIWPVASETMLRLRRDKILAPAIVISILIILLASVTGHWAIEEFTKVLFDIGTAGFQFAGSMVAIFWGTKCISDAKREGSLEVQLSSPISRQQWIVGKFFGLMFTLLLVGLIIMLNFQLVLIYWDLGLLSINQLAIFGYIFLSWLVLGSLAIWLATITSNAIAIFSSMFLWFLGLVSNPIANTLNPDTPESTRWLIETFARLWDLQQFNLSAFAVNPNSFPTQQELINLAIYGVCLICVMISGGSLAFQNRDIIAD